MALSAPRTRPLSLGRIPTRLLAIGLAAAVGLGGAYVAVEGNPLAARQQAVTFDTSAVTQGTLQTNGSATSAVAGAQADVDSAQQALAGSQQAAQSAQDQANPAFQSDQTTLANAQQAYQDQLQTFEANWGQVQANLDQQNVAAQNAQ